VVCVTGCLGDFSEWSIGESTPRNTTNNYPFAMAEKRAKDRVILKLLGVAGFVYSEQEADNFERSNPDLVPTKEEKAAQVKQETESQEEESKPDDNGFDPLEQEARNFWREVAVKTDRKNMKTQKEYLDYTRGGHFGSQIQKFIETETYKTQIAPCLQAAQKRLGV